MKASRFTLVWICLAICGCSKNINKPTIIAWGDSFTYGTGSTDASYPSVLEKLSGYRVINRGTAGNTSTQIKNKLLADKQYYRYPSIIWVGRNNLPDSVTILKDIDEMVNALGRSHFLVLSILNSETEGIGTARYTTIQRINRQLATAYGNRFIDIKAYLQTHRDTSLMKDDNITTYDITPTSLRADNLHLNSQGYQLVAQKVYESIDILLK
ncbi:hypothetical protein GCM10023149_05300 [Mucilaginibacter gynuensis]|uniref:SGNH hydrolase-type esterase domain-containing protein n=1 Tax=Mucilaginibacter gynuensis TaxID=1302236 RepID=A0ABP8FTC0_9SPHI